MSDDAHYFSRTFSSTPSGDAQERTLQVRLAGREVAVTTAPGVFSGNRVDLGTRVLLREVPPPPVAGDLLDLGCGWGPVALTMALLAPRARVWALDVNPRAVDLTRRNAQHLGLGGVHACTPEEVPETIRFAAIWSNPPIRVGKPALHAMLAAWLPRLDQGSSAWLVVQRNLGGDSLHRWLADTLGEGWEVARHGSAKGYRVLRATTL